jgi:hypothetical protein
LPAQKPKNIPRIKAPNGELPLPDSGQLLTVRKFVEQTGKSVRSISRQKWSILGTASKRPADAIQDFIIVARDRVEAVLERDDVLHRLLQQRATYGKATVHSVAELASEVPETLAPFLQAVLERRAKARRLPDDVGLLEGSKGPCFFLFKHAVGQPAGKDSEKPQTDGVDFSQAFNEAFDRLRRQRTFNMVELSALRRALPGFSREAFDLGLRELRESDEFVLESFEGRHGALSPEDIAAAIREDGRVFAYAARRDHG